MDERIIRELYHKIVNKAILQEKKNDLHQANRCLQASSYLAYHFYLSYDDKVADKLIQKIASRIKTNDGFQPCKDGRCVFLDSSSTFNGGLKLQYLKAIIAAGWPVLYLTDNNMASWRYKQLYDFLVDKPNVSIVWVQKNLRGVRKMQFMYNAIVNYHPERLFIHISPDAPYYAEVCASIPKNITRYLINYTDHSFLLGVGANICDYCICQNNLGTSVSNIWRGIDKERLFLLPFYPNMINHPFQGLPDICQGKVIIFSGGNMWKILDENETYFKLCKDLLNNIKNSIILYAGGGQTEVIRKLLQKYDISDKFILIGWRDDIVSLFEKCDLYLSTFPAYGGLMSTYACLLEKPILALSREKSTSKIEDAVCSLGYYSISKLSIKEVVAEAKRMLDDKLYYKEVVEQQKRVTVTEDWFNKTFKECIEKNINCGPEIKIDSTRRILQRNIDDSIAYHTRSKGWIRMIANILGPQAISIDVRLIIPLIQSWFYMDIRHRVKDFLVKIKVNG